MLFSLLFSMVGAALALAAPVTDGDFEVKTARISSTCVRSPSRIRGSSVGGVAIGAIGGNAALGMSVGRAADLRADYIDGKSKEAVD